MSDDAFPEVLDMKQAAKRLGRSVRWLTDYIRDNPFGRKVGVRRIFTPEDYSALLDSFPKDASRFYPGSITPKRVIRGVSGRVSVADQAAFEALLASIPNHKPRRNKL